MKKIGGKTLGLALFVGAATVAVHAQPMSDQNLVAIFSNMSDESFEVQVIAPPSVVREYAVCKMVWFAEKKHAETISFGNPHYGDPKAIPNVPREVPDNWVALQATAYLAAHNPDGNPVLSVAERAARCRPIWDWYR